MRSWWDSNLSSDQDRTSQSRVTHRTIFVECRYPISLQPGHYPWEHLGIFRLLHNCCTLSFNPLWSRAYAFEGTGSVDRKSRCTRLQVSDVELQTRKNALRIACEIVEILNCRDAFSFVRYRNVPRSSNPCCTGTVRQVGTDSGNAKGLGLGKASAVRCITTTVTECFTCHGRRMCTSRAGTAMDLLLHMVATFEKHHHYHGRVSRNLHGTSSVNQIPSVRSATWPRSQSSSSQSDP